MNNVKILKRRIPFNIFRVIRAQYRFASLLSTNKNKINEQKEKKFNIKKTGN